MQVDIDAIKMMGTPDIRHYIVEYMKVASAARATARKAFEEGNLYTQAVEALANELRAREGIYPQEEPCTPSAP